MEHQSQVAGAITETQQLLVQQLLLAVVQEAVPGAILELQVVLAVVDLQQTLAQPVRKVQLLDM